MLSSWQGYQAFLGLHFVLVWQEGAEPLICQQQHGALHGQPRHKAMMPSWEGPDP